MRSCGIAPLLKWVDDHIFFQIPQSDLEAYNMQHKQWAQDITTNGGDTHNGGHLWFKGATMPNNQPEEFNEDISFVIQDLSQSSDR